MVEPIRILLIDDHAVFRAGLRMLIENHAALKVIGEAGDRHSAIAAITEFQPDLALLDLDMGGDDGLAFLPQLLSASKQTKIIILTGIADVEAHRQSVNLGAMGLVLKQEVPDTLIKAILAVHSGEAWFDRNLLWHIIAKSKAEPEPRIKDPEEQKIAGLSERERQVVALITKGLKNHQIAEHLRISESTVRHHLTAIFSKLGTEDRFELVVYAYEHGLTSAEK